MLDLINDRPPLPPERYEHEMQAAVRYAVAMQEHAGLDVVTDGEWWRKSYIGVIAELAHGFELGASPDGRPLTMVVDKLAPKTPGFIAREVKFLKTITTRFVKSTLPSPALLGERMWNAEKSAKAYPKRDDFVRACVPILYNRSGESTKGAPDGPTSRCLSVLARRGNRRGAAASLRPDRRDAPAGHRGGLLPRRGCQRLRARPNGEHPDRVSEAAAQQMERAAAAGADVVMMYCGIEPGVVLARERVKVPVVGTAQSTLSVASQLGVRLGMVCYESSTRRR